MSLNKAAQDVIIRTIDRIHKDIQSDLHLTEYEIFISTDPKKMFDDEMFFGSSYDESAIYLFADAATIHKTLSNSRHTVAKHAAEHCYRSLYTTARIKHIGLDTDCGLLEEVVNEGLAEIFVTEKMSTKPKKRFTRLPEGKIKQLWEKIKNEHKMSAPNVEKWFQGSEKENIPPFTACSVGYAIADAYLSPHKKKSHEALTTLAKHIAKQQRYY